MMRIARVFPRRTNATPTDSLSFSQPQPPVSILDVDEIHFSVTFSYDKDKAEAWAEQWRVLGVPILFGGPAYGLPGGEFEPGMYLKRGYTITSRGCPNNCWFCSVPAREGKIRELTITDGWNILDDNLLATSEMHLRAVFSMLDRQPERPIFSGGLEAKLLRPWHAELIHKVGTHHMFFAYDTPDDYEPLLAAGRMLQDVGYTMESHALRAYVLIGYRGDTLEKAERRLMDTLRAGFWPMAMLFKDEAGHEDPEWRRFQGQWVRPAELHAKLRDGGIAL